MTDELHSQNKFYVPILDAGLAQREQTHNEYSQYKDGKSNDVFIKDYNGQYITGRVWPNDAVFPDFFKNETKDWWMEELTQMWKNVGFDGLWLDMNEVSNFCDGICYDE